MREKLFIKLVTSSGSSLQIKTLEEPGDVNDFTKSFAHILNVETFVVHLTFYSINGVTFANVKCF